MGVHVVIAARDTEAVFVEVRVVVVVVPLLLLLLLLVELSMPVARDGGAIHGTVVPKRGKEKGWEVGLILLKQIASLWWC